MRICWIIITYYLIPIIHVLQVIVYVRGGGGDSQKDASLKIRIKCLKGTSLGMAQALFDPFYGDRTPTRISLSGRS